MRLKILFQLHVSHEMVRRLQQFRITSVECCDLRHGIRQHREEPVSLGGGEAHVKTPARILGLTQTDGQREIAQGRAQELATCIGDADSFRRA